MGADGVRRQPSHLWVSLIVCVSLLKSLFVKRVCKWHIVYTLLLIVVCLWVFIQLKPDTASRWGLAFGAQAQRVGS